MMIRPLSLLSLDISSIASILQLHLIEGTSELQDKAHGPHCFQRIF